MLVKISLDFQGQFVHWYYFFRSLYIVQTEIYWMVLSYCRVSYTVGWLQMVLIHI
jgi:hypothetical protein